MITRETLHKVTKSLRDGHWKVYRKKIVVCAVKMSRPFNVETRQGIVTCEDGYLAIDSQGWPYPIATDEFDFIYEEVKNND